MRALAVIITAAGAALLAGEPGLISPAPVLAGPGVNPLGSVSPDGLWLSMVNASTGELIVRGTRNPSERRVTKSAPGQFAYFSAFAPDSRTIAWAWFNEARFYELRVGTIDGGEPRVVYRNEEAGFVQPCAWSPDGKQILTLLFRRDNISQIALIPAGGGPAQVLKSLNWIYPKRMDWSPDGRYIVYDSVAKDGASGRDIYLLAADGSGETVLVDHAASDVFPVWSRDGRTVYFASDRSGTMDLWAQPVDDGRVAGTPRRIAAGLGRFLPMGLTDDGRLFVGVRTGTTDVAVEGRILPSMFPGRNSRPGWSENGRWLAYLSRRETENYGEESRAILLRDMQSGREQDLGSPLAHAERVWPSADGQRVLVQGSDGKGRAGAFLFDVRTRRVTPLFVEHGGDFRGVPAAWDGAAMYHSRGSQVFAFETKVLDAGCAVDRLAVRHRVIAFACGNSLSIASPSGLMLPKLVTQLEHPVSEMTWTADGDLLLVSGGSLYRVSKAAGRPESAGRSPEGSSVAIGADGRLAYTSGTIRGEILALQLEPK